MTAKMPVLSCQSGALYVELAWKTRVVVVKSTIFGGIWLWGRSDGRVDNIIENENTLQL